MQTAVQELKYLFDDILKDRGVSIAWDTYLAQEKQQIIDAGNSCGMKMHLYRDKMEKMSVEQYIIEAHNESPTFGEQYYNETYGSKGSDEIKQ